MTRQLHESLAQGYFCLSAWSDLLDRINVFPVADGDTGSNLRITLAPFRNPDSINAETGELLLRNATGNSGNIAAAFFKEFCEARKTSELVQKAELGRNKAWEAISEPREGTMLTVFDNLIPVLRAYWDSTLLYEKVSNSLQEAVSMSSELLPEVREAGVVDAGALATYLFFIGFFGGLTKQSVKMVDLYSIFYGRLEVKSGYGQTSGDGHCVNLLVEVDQKGKELTESLDELGDSVVVVKNKEKLKVHMHTTDPEQLQEHVEQFGEILQWKDEELKEEQLPDVKDGLLHIITDSASSLNRETAKKLGISLLDSYILHGSDARPESLYEPEYIYGLMRRGKKITTAQSSNFERHQHYDSLIRQFGKCLYLCVGSAFTGNYEVAKAWQEENDNEDLMTVLDTGAASGRLALIALLTARKSRRLGRPEAIIAHAQECIKSCKEFVFIDELKYLVAGGRVSKMRGRFGDLLRMKPIISPTSNGVEKVGVVRSGEKQLDFAVDQLITSGATTASTCILLQYSDNQQWVDSIVRTELEALFPRAEIILTPLSLTSGVHMGPGTWSIAFAPPGL